MKISLRSARANIGLNAKEVASIIGVHQNTLLEWERGITQPPIDKVIELCAIYGIGIENLKFEEKEGK